jgi:hypothetical protein
VIVARQRLVDLSRVAEIHSLWIGERLSWIELVSLHSRLEHGHRVTLWCYDPIEGVPNGVPIADAATILPKTSIIRHRQTCSALRSEWDDPAGGNQGTLRGLLVCLPQSPWYTDPAQRHPGLPASYKCAAPYEPSLTGPRQPYGGPARGMRMTRRLSGVDRFSSPKRSAPYSWARTPSVRDTGALRATTDVHLSSF